MIEKMLEKFEELRMRYFLTIANGGDEKLDCAYVYVGKAIDQCKEIVQEVAKDGGWIPCSERLPEEHKKYLVTCEGIDIPQIRLFEGTWDSYAHKVTAWQPLPTLYQKGETHE